MRIGHSGHDRLALMKPILLENNLNNQITLVWHKERGKAMSYDPEKPRRNSIRLKDYDYSQEGAYYVTICVYEKKKMFGEISDETMRLNERGMLVTEIWEALPTRFPHVELDQYIVMPNHIHGILILTEPDTQVNAVKLGEIIRVFKAVAAYKIHKSGVNDFRWQRSYNDHVIRNDLDFHRICQYILDNPIRWAEKMREKDTLS